MSTNTDKAPTTPTSILHQPGTQGSGKSVRIDLDKNTSRPTFECVGCKGRFNENEVEQIKCGHYICVKCAIEVLSGEEREGLLEECSGCKALQEEDFQGTSIEGQGDSNNDGEAEER